MKEAWWAAGLVLLWASVPLVTAGAYDRTLSPWFGEYQRRAIREEVGTGPGERLNPAGRMALLLSFSWQFECLASGSVAALFTTGVFGIRALGRRNRDVSLLAAGAFGLAALLGAGAAAGEATDSFRWGFAVLGIGYLVAAVGLAAGGVGVVWSGYAGRPAKQGTSG